MHGLITALQKIAITQNQTKPPRSEPPFGAFMAKMKYRSNIAEVFDEKSSDAYIDSGATHHFFHRRSAFISYSEMNEEPVRGATGFTKIVGKGTVRLPIDNGMIVEAYHAPAFSSNVLAVRLPSKDFEVLFSDSIRNCSGCFFLRKGTFDIVNKYPLENGLSPIKMDMQKKQVQNFHAQVASVNSIDEWHRKLGHIHAERLLKLSQTVQGIPQLSRADLFSHKCIPCITAKARRSSLMPSSRKTPRLLELVRLDISGPVEPSLEKLQYTVEVLDDFTAKSDVYLLKARSELLDTFFEYKARSENELQDYGFRLTNIRMDRAGENLSNAVKEFCKHHGIGLEPSPAYAKQSNGAAERLIQEHWTRARVMLFASNLLNYLWPEAVTHGNWLRNRLPASRINGDIPIKRWDPCSRINYAKLLEFGAPGFAYIYREDTTKGKKLLTRSVFGYFVGMASDLVLIKVFIWHTTTILFVRRSDFRVQNKSTLLGIEVLLDGIAKQLAREQEEEKANEQEAHLDNAFLSAHRLLPQCLASKKTKFDPHLQRDSNEACQYPRWRIAIDREYNALIKRGTWSHLKLEPGLNPVPFTWVFKRKILDTEGKKFMEKALCCVRGDCQLAYVDYDPENIYEPVTSQDSIRMLIALPASQDVSLEGADVSNAYLYGDLDISIIMEQPTDSTQVPAMPGYACKLTKSIYGAKQAGEI